MRDENHSAFVFIERFCDDGKMPEIDMIRRLVEYEESWFLENELAEHEESLLSL